MVSSATTEPLLRDSEREAVSTLLRYLEHGTYLYTKLAEDYKIQYRLLVNCTVHDVYK